MSPLTVLDLFSGIGGFSLGLERTGGFKTVAFCEIDPFCRRVLAKHWPEVPCYDDVCTLDADTLGRDGIGVDIICGGFPCQDISHAGKGAGIEGKRSGLWRQYARLIGELRPAYVVVENVTALLGRGIDVVLGDLATLGYDAEWHSIPASAVGAPHLRDRIWIVAHAQHPDADHSGSHRAGVHFERSAEPGNEQVDVSGSMGAALADANLTGLEGRDSEVLRQRAGQRPAGPRRASVAHAYSVAPLGTAIARAECNPWVAEPDVGRVADGVPARVDRLRSLGNAVVPQIPELIGRAILSTLGRAAA